MTVWSGSRTTPSMRIQVACIRCIAPATLLTMGFLLLESDLIYEARALDVLLGSQAADAVLLSGPTNAGDEVYVEAPDGLLVQTCLKTARSWAQSRANLSVSTKISRGLFALMKHISQ